MHDELFVSLTVVLQRAPCVPPHFHPSVGPLFVFAGSCCATTSL
jgi:hypothetical protein